MCCCCYKAKTYKNSFYESLGNKKQHHIVKTHTKVFHSLSTKQKEILRFYATTIVFHIEMEQKQGGKKNLCISICIMYYLFLELMFFFFSLFWGTFLFVHNVNQINQIFYEYFFFFRDSVQ